MLTLATMTATICFVLLSPPLLCIVGYSYHASCPVPACCSISSHWFHAVISDMLNILTYCWNPRKQYVSMELQTEPRFSTNICIPPTEPSNVWHIHNLLFGSDCFDKHAIGNQHFLKFCSGSSAFRSGCCHKSVCLAHRDSLRVLYVPLL